MQSKNKENDNRKNNKNQFKINYYFNENGENFEQLIERTFGNYCINKLK